MHDGVKVHDVIKRTRRRETEMKRRDVLRRTGLLGGAFESTVGLSGDTGVERLTLRRSRARNCSMNMLCSVARVLDH